MNWLLKITTGAICENNCLEFWKWDWVGISAFLFLLLAITLYIADRKNATIKKLEKKIKRLKKK